jgi:hypothetical protein
LLPFGGLKIKGKLKKYGTALVYLKSDFISNEKDNRRCFRRQFYHQLLVKRG